MIVSGHNSQEKNTYTFCSSAQGTFSRIGHILRHKTNLNKFKSIGIISSIFFDHNGMKVEINHRKRNEKKLTNHIGTKQNATEKPMGQ